jgi:TolA-binding protein
MVSALYRKVAVCTLLLAAMVVLSGCAKHVATPEESDLIVAGWEHFRMGEFNQAVSSFEAVLDSGNTNRVPDALYGLATTWDLRMPVTSQNDKLAAKLYREVYEKYPQHQLAPWSMLALARMQHLVPVGHKPDYTAVKKAYRELWQKYPESQAGQEAFIHLQSVHVHTMNKSEIRSAIKALRDFVDQHPQSGQLYAAWVLLAQAYIIEGDGKELLNAQIQALNTREIDKTNPFVENSWRYWTVATTAEFAVGDFDTARKYYRKLLEEYPQDIRCYACEESLKRMDRMENELRKQLKDGSTQ